MKSELQKSKGYEIPQVEVVDINVEKGFAISNDNNEITPSEPGDGPF